MNPTEQMDIALIAAEFASQLKNIDKNTTTKASTNPDACRLDPKKFVPKGADVLRHLRGEPVSNAIPVVPPTPTHNSPSQPMPTGNVEDLLIPLPEGMAAPAPAPVLAPASAQEQFQIPTNPDNPSLFEQPGFALNFDDAKIHKKLDKIIELLKMLVKNTRKSPQEPNDQSK